MKHIKALKTSWIIALFFALFATACGGSNSNPEHGSASIPEPEPDVILTDSLDLGASSVDWTRVLDQKATKKKMKLFGAEVDVEVGAMTLDMSGSVDPTSGTFTTTNDEATKANLKFDMATFKFAAEKGSGLFDIKKYPESELVFNSFGPVEAGDSVHSHMANMTLTIQDHSQEISAPMNIESSATGTSLRGKFTFNTLDFPLRDPNTQATVNKDEITVNLKLSYNR